MQLVFGYPGGWWTLDGLLGGRRIRFPYVAAGFFSFLAIRNGNRVAVWVAGWVGKLPKWSNWCYPPKLVNAIFADESSRISNASRVWYP